MKREISLLISLNPENRKLICTTSSLIEIAHIAMRNSCCVTCVASSLKGDRSNEISFDDEIKISSLSPNGIVHKRFLISNQTSADAQMIRDFRLANPCTTHDTTLFPFQSEKITKGGEKTGRRSKRQTVIFKKAFQENFIDDGEIELV